MSSKVVRTYSNRSRLSFPSSPSSNLASSSPPPVIIKHKRPFEDAFASSTAPPLKKRAKSLTTTKSNSKDELKPKKKTLTQLHFCIETSILRTCPLCDLSYTKGAPGDEKLHRAHCSRVQKGMEWGREEEKEKMKAGVQEVGSLVRLKNGMRGRIIFFQADVGGKIGSKLSTLIDTVNLALSAPPLDPTIIRVSKVYLLLVPTLSASSRREKIVGCVIAQRISSGMAIAEPSLSSSSSPSPLKLIPVDHSSSLFCHPTPLPTPLGILRLFVSSTHRRQGVASKLLSAAAQTFIHGCPLDPAKGEVAFTQPTAAGASVMRAWGKSGVRIYEE